MPFSDDFAYADGLLAGNGFWKPLNVNPQTLIFNGHATMNSDAFAGVEFGNWDILGDWQLDFDLTTTSVFAASDYETVHIYLRYTTFASAWLNSEFLEVILNGTNPGDVQVNLGGLTATQTGIAPGTTLHMRITQITGVTKLYIDGVDSGAGDPYGPQPSNPTANVWLALGGYTGVSPTNSAYVDNLTLAQL